MATLFLHIGMPKTGTSALQAALAANRETLSARGVHYARNGPDPSERPGEITSGNGVALGLRLRPDERPRGYDSDAFDAAFATAFLSPDHPISLISSESLAGARRGPLETLRDACAEAAPIRIVAFVRDLYPHAHASWMQRIKRAAYAHDFPTYCRTFYDNPQVRSLRLYRKVFGAERISVIHYDNMEEDLLAALGGAMGVDLSDLPPCTRVNRSLTGAEARGMMSLNRLHGSPVLSKAATDRLLMRIPAGPRASPGRPRRPSS